MLLPLYRVVKESTAQSRFEAAVQRGLTPLEGREYEIALLVERWGNGRNRPKVKWYC